MLWLLFPNNRHTFFHFHCISVNFFRCQRQTCLLDLVCPWLNTYRHTICIQEIWFYVVVVEVFGKSAVRSLSTEEGTLSLIKNHMSTVYTPPCMWNNPHVAVSPLNKVYISRNFSSIWQLNMSSGRQSACVSLDTAVTSILFWTKNS